MKSTRIGASMLADGHDLARGLNVQVIDQQHSAQDSIALERLHMHIALYV
jgi:hypothetical protein